MTPEQATALRRPFPKESVGILPKPYKKDSPKGNCPECGGYHGLPAVHLDYAGHAAVTDRLLMVDAEWTWEPMAFDQFGSPMTDRDGNLWIRLTVRGVTRLGCGDGSSMKERIGDAIRNAAMRFGVGLDLWAKEHLVEFAQAIAPRTPPERPVRAHEQAPGGGAKSQGEGEEIPLPGVDVSPGHLATGVEPAGEEDESTPTPSPERRGPRKAGRAQHRMIFATLSDLGVEDDEDGTARKFIASRITGRDVFSFADLTPGEASQIIDTLARVGSADELYALIDEGVLS